MKKIFTIIGLALGFATTVSAQTSFGLKAGVNFPKLITKFDDTKISSDAATGFYLTGYADFSLANNFSFQPGISLQNKGGKFTVNNNNEIDNELLNPNLNLMYIEVPLNFVYNIPAGPGNIFIGAGPYAAYGVNAKIKQGNHSESGSFDNLDIKPFDAGLNFLGGYKLSQGFLINAGYGLGLTNLDKDSGGNTKNKVFSIGVGYQF